MDGQPVEEVAKEKYLGVVFTKELKVAENCNEAYSKANCMLGLISRMITVTEALVLRSHWKTRGTSQRRITESVHILVHCAHRQNQTVWKRNVFRLW